MHNFLYPFLEYWAPLCSLTTYSSLIWSEIMKLLFQELFLLKTWVRITDLTTRHVSYAVCYLNVCGSPVWYHLLYLKPNLDNQISAFPSSIVLRSWLPLTLLQFYNCKQDDHCFSVLLFSSPHCSSSDIVWSRS